MRLSSSWVWFLRDLHWQACEALLLGAIELCGVDEMEMGRSHSSVASSDAMRQGVFGPATQDAMGGSEEGLEKRHK